jgi:hypothetical protein
VQEPDTKSHTVKDGIFWELGFGKVVYAAFSMDGRSYLLVVEF